MTREKSIKVVHNHRSTKKNNLRNTFCHRMDYQNGLPENDSIIYFLTQNEMKLKTNLDGYKKRDGGSSFSFYKIHI